MAEICGIENIIYRSMNTHISFSIQSNISFFFSNLFDHIVLGMGVLEKATMIPA